MTFYHGVIAGRIARDGTHYSVAPRGRGITQLGHVRSEYWKTHPDEEQQNPSALARGLVAGTADSPVGWTWDIDCPSALDLSEYHNVDVLVLYTPQAFNDYGGSVTAVTSVMKAAINDANDALINNGIEHVRYILVGVEAAPPLPPSQSYDLPTIVDARNSVAGIFEDSPPNSCSVVPNNPVRALRDAYHADVVALARVPTDLIDNSCGVTWVQRRVAGVCVMEPGAAWEKFSYLVFRPGCSEDRLNLAHELGHVLGMEHDPQNSPLANISFGQAAPSCPWSFGHRQRGAITSYPFRTVMSYHDSVTPGGYSSGPAPCSNSNDCPQIDAYANPALEYRGPVNNINPYSAGVYPRIGVPGVSTPASNAWDTLQRIGPIVAQFRARPDLIFAHGFEQ